MLYCMAGEHSVAHAPWQDAIACLTAVPEPGVLPTESGEALQGHMGPPVTL